MSTPRLAVLLPLLALGLACKYMAYLASIDPRYSSALWGFTPLYALGLYCPARYRSAGWAFIAVPVVYALGDLAILASGAPLHEAFQPLPTALNYAAMLAIVGCGAMNRGQSSPLRLLGSGVLGAVVFYALTNFGAWWYDPQMPTPSGYTRDLAGLLDCYWLGVPFAENMFGAMLVYSALFFSPAGETLLTVGDADTASASDAIPSKLATVPVRVPTDSKSC
jgi:hypothetical protein